MKTLNEKQQRMVEENLDIVDIILHTKVHANQSIPGMEYDDLYSVGCMALCKAAETYTGQTKFATYASKVVYHAMIDECRRVLSKRKRNISYDTAIDENDNDSFEVFLGEPEELETNLICEELMSIVEQAKHTYKGAVLKGVEAIELQIKGYSGKEIAAMYGVTDNNVTSWISKAKQALRMQHPEFVS